MIKTDRLNIHPATEDEMVTFIAGIEDEDLRQAYQEMLDGCRKNPHQWEWYATWMIELKDGTHIGESCFKGITEKGSVEIGYGIAEEYQGCGYATEAVSALTDWALTQPGVMCVMAETEESNIASRKTLDKAGFKATGETGEEGPLYVRKKDCSAMKIIKLSDNQEMAPEAVEWFSSKWNIPEEAYRESIEASFSASVPSWYLCLDGDRIVAGMGVIENDFHDRKDLTPNVCAVFTEEEYRCRGIAGRLLNFVCNDMASHGIDTLYLLTNHTGFYERYGWEFFCMANGDGEDEPSRMYVHRAKNYRDEAVKCVKDCVLPMQKRIYAKYNGDFDRIYTEEFNNKSYTGKVIEPGKVYELSYLECTCPKVKCGLIRNPEQCECSRQSILYVMSQLEPGSIFDVQIVDTILRGGVCCTFRIKKSL